MPTESFQLRYLGGEVGDGAINVYELAPALLAVGDLIRDANRYLNGDQASVNLKVDADFRKGSFEIHLLLQQCLLETANQTLAFASVIDASGLIRTLFGAAKEHSDKIAEGVIVGLFAIYKLLRGEKPQPGITIQDNHGVINVGGREIRVDARGAQMFMNDLILADVDHIVRSVVKDGIDKLEVLSDGKLLDDVTKEDLPSRVRALESPPESAERVLTNTREALVKVVAANFEEGKWKFSDGGTKFNAAIADPLFRQKLDNRQEGFYKGDVLRVMLKSEQMEKANGKIQARYVVQEVLEHRQTGTQQELLRPSNKSTPPK